VFAETQLVSSSTNNKMKEYNLIKLVLELFFYEQNIIRFLLIFRLLFVQIFAIISILCNELNTSSFIITK
jgi:hypothetical protein